MSVKRNKLIAGKKYSLGDVDNVFLVLAVHNNYHWIEWVDNDDVESVYFERNDLKKINPSTEKEINPSTEKEIIMKLTPEEMTEALQNYACDKFGIVGRPTVYLIANNDIEESAVISENDIYEVVVILK
tara:strand:- start:77 stop:463 length:387 start_codon:yes stop_codon:yes gene_type:complete